METVEIKIEDNSNHVLKLFDVAIYRGLDAIGMTAERHAKEIVTRKVYDVPQNPNSTYIRTGRLRNGIAYEVRRLEKAVIIGDRVDYAVYVELGTSKMAERAFIRPAAQNYSAEYKQLMEDSLKNA